MTSQRRRRDEKKQTIQTRTHTHTLILFDRLNDVNQFEEGGFYQEALDRLESVNLPLSTCPDTWRKHLRCSPRWRKRGNSTLIRVYKANARRWTGTQARTNWHRGLFTNELVNCFNEPLGQARNGLLIATDKPLLRTGDPRGPSPTSRCLKTLEHRFSRGPVFSPCL